MGPVENTRIERVWFDATASRLYVQAGDFVNSIDLARLPDADFGR